MTGNLLYRNVGLALDIVQGLASLFGVLGQAQEHGAEGLAVHVAGVRPQNHKWLNRVLGWIINVGRSLPFIILMIAIMPFTKLVVGTKIGVKGAIVPLVVSAAPFIARMVETSLAEVDAGVVEAAQSMGASTWQIVTKVMLPEALPSLISGGTITVATIRGCSYGDGLFTGFAAAACQQAQAQYNGQCDSDGLFHF